MLILYYVKDRATKLDIPQGNQRRILRSDSQESCRRLGLEYYLFLPDIKTTMSHSFLYRNHILWLPCERANHKDTNPSRRHSSHWISMTNYNLKWGRPSFNFDAESSSKHVNRLLWKGIAHHRRFCLVMIQFQWRESG